MDQLSSTKKGKVAEFALVARLLKFGFNVFTPACDDAGVDLIAKIPRGIYIELQVKARIVWKNTDTFIINDFPDDCNFFVACYDLRKGDCFFIPGSVVKASCQRIGKNGNWYVITYYFLQNNVRYKNKTGMKNIISYLDNLF